MTRSRLNPMIMISLILAMMLVFVTIYLSYLQPEKSAKPIKIATGEWTPFTGENIQHNGIATIIVSSVLEQMGYAPSYQFMPWPLVQSRAENSQRNDHVRGIYPYVETEERAKRFYFSEGIIKIAYGVFYHKGNNPNAQQIDSHDALKNFNILALDGYEYDNEISRYIPRKPCFFKDTIAGFEYLITPRKTVLLSEQPISVDLMQFAANASQTKQLNIVNSLADINSMQVTLDGYDSPLYLAWMGSDTPTDVTALKNYRIITHLQDKTRDKLNIDVTNECGIDQLEASLIALANSAKPAVLVEAQQVAENLVLNRFPEQANSIRKAKYFRFVEHRMMFPKNNPNNLALRDEFDEVLQRLKSNKDAYDTLIRKASNAIELEQSISLLPAKSNSLIEVFRLDRDSDRCLKTERYFLPKGSKAKINQWNRVFLTPNYVEDVPMVRIKLLNGPLSSKNMRFCIDARSIKIS